MVRLPWCLSGKESVCNAGATGDSGSIPGSGRSPERGWQPTAASWPGESHGQGSQAGYSASPQGCEELDTTDVTWHAHMHPRSLQ